MPTSPASDVLPVSRRTKERLRVAKGSRTFDALVRELLRAVPPAELARRLDAAERRESARAVAAREARLEPRRSPAKQTLLADLAERSFADWIASGRVARVGPRRVRFQVIAPRGSSEVRVARRPGRGLAP